MDLRTAPHDIGWSVGDAAPTTSTLLASGEYPALACGVLLASTGNLLRQRYSATGCLPTNPPERDDCARLRLARRSRRDRAGHVRHRDRPRSRSLTFGAGIHHWVGADLARAEMHETLAFLGERVRAITPEGEPELGSASGIYGLESLPVRLEL
jgi:hypothetical protein